MTVTGRYQTNKQTNKQTDSETQKKTNIQQMHKQSYKWPHAQADLKVATRRHVQKMKNEAL